MKRKTLFFFGLLLACGALVAVSSRMAAQDVKRTADIAVVVNPQNSTLR